MRFATREGRQFPAGSEPCTPTLGRPVTRGGYNLVYCHWYSKFQPAFHLHKRVNLRNFRYSGIMSLLLRPITRTLWQIAVLTFSAAFVLDWLWYVLHGYGTDFSKGEIALYLAGDLAFLFIVGCIAELASKSLPGSGNPKPILLESLAIALGAIPQFVQHLIGTVLSINHAYFPEPGKLPTIPEQPKNLLFPLLHNIFFVSSVSAYALCLVAILIIAGCIAFRIAWIVDLKNPRSILSSNTLIYFLSISLYSLNILLLSPAINDAKIIEPPKLSIISNIETALTLATLLLIYFWLSKSARNLVRQAPVVKHPWILAPLLVVILAFVSLIAFLAVGFANNVASWVGTAPSLRLPHIPQILPPAALRLVGIAVLLSVSFYLILSFWRNIATSLFQVGPAHLAAFRALRIRVGGLPRLSVGRRVALVVLIPLFVSLPLLVWLFRVPPASAPVARPPVAVTADQNERPRILLPPRPAPPRRRYPLYEFKVHRLACTPVAWRFRSTSEIGSVEQNCSIADEGWSDIIAIGSASSEGHIRTENVRALRRGERLAAMVANPYARLHILNLGRIDNRNSAVAQRQLTIISATHGPDEASTSSFEQQLGTFLRLDASLSAGSQCMLYEVNSLIRQSSGINLGCSKFHQTD